MNAGAYMRIYIHGTNDTSTPRKKDARGAMRSKLEYYFLTKAGGT